MNQFQRVEPDDPNRCQAVTAQGQCMNAAMPESQYCPAHGGNKAKESKDKDAANMYRLTKWKAHLERMKEHPEIKSLRDEIGILRMLMEERLNRCLDTTDLLFNAGAISDLVIKIEKVVKSCHTLEASMGQHLDKTKLINFATEIIAIIDEHISDPEILQNIGTKISEAAERATDITKQDP